jgi:nitrite reductase/ring-hydroxylating ferredoxin subunit
MFSRLVRPFWRGFFTPKKIIAATTVLAYSFFRTQKMLLDSVVMEESSNAPISDEEPTVINLDSYIKKLQTADVCEGKELVEGQRKVVAVLDHEGKERKIMVMRLNGKLYSFSAACPHREPFETDYSSLEDAVCFNDKLFCPHHGCVFDVKSGSVEHGPSLLNLPIFFAEEKNGIVKLIYPLAMPSSVAPSMLERDV